MNKNVTRAGTLRTGSNILVLEPSIVAAMPSSNDQFSPFEENKAYGIGYPSDVRLDNDDCGTRGSKFL
jgi:hypothetical protein